MGCACASPRAQRTRHSLKLEPEPSPGARLKEEGVPPRKDLWHQLWSFEFWSLSGSVAYMNYTCATMESVTHKDLKIMPRKFSKVFVIVY